MKLLESLPQEPFTREQEFALASRIQKTKNEDDINDLALHNMREAFLYSKRCSRNKIDDDELFSLCFITLKRNAKRFRPGGLRFLAFAKAGLRGALSRYWKTLDVVKNASMHENREDLGQFEYLPMQRFRTGVFPAIDVTSERNTTATDWNTESLVPFIPEPSEDADFRGIDFRERMAIIADIMKRKLTPQEQMVIELVYKSQFTFPQIGALTKTTRSAAQLTHSKALRKIRNELMRSKRLLLNE